MRRPNHASRFEGTAKTNLQPSRASDTETLQSQVNKAAKKRLSLSGLEILHGRLSQIFLPRSVPNRHLQGALRTKCFLRASVPNIALSHRLHGTPCTAPSLLIAARLTRLAVYISPGWRVCKTHPSYDFLQGERAFVVDFG